jgi:hypothetical protein
MLQGGGLRETEISEGESMAVSTWTESDTAKAEQIWAKYQEQHDLSNCVGHTAGIDPTTGSVWIGESIQSVLAQRDVAGIDALLFFEQVGAEAYYRRSTKGEVHELQDCHSSH